MTIHDIATPLSLPKVHTIQNVGESGGKWGQSGGWWEWTIAVDGLPQQLVVTYS